MPATFHAKAVVRNNNSAFDGKYGAREEMKQLDMWDMDNSFIKLKTERSTDWHWCFNEYPQKNGLTAFSCFSGGGGSTMGYKLTGIDVIGNCEIDAKMNDMYIKNHNPKFNYCMDLRIFNKKDKLPNDLYRLDILDGSPPCTTFSMSGKRSKFWGKTKKFREGQAEQTLDDLLFVFIDTVAKLRPKVAIMENVEGLVLGSAWQYVQNIYKRFNQIGYTVRHWLLKGETMGVPQTRHRVFFIATRLDYDLSKLDMTFNYAPIPFDKIKSQQGQPLGKSKGTIQELIFGLRYGDKGLDTVCKRIKGKGSFFNNNIIYDDKVCRTITAKSVNIRWDTKNYLSKQDIINASTFPQDYDFINTSHTNICYVCGMSVPPVMIKRIATRLIESGIFDAKEKVKFKPL